MLMNEWQDQAPKSGTFTVLSVTLFSNGEKEALATTIFDPSVIKRKKRDVEKEHEQLLCSTGVTGDKAVEILEAYFEPRKPISELEREENKQRSLRRAKTVIRKKIIEGELDHFMTLTYRDNKTDLKEAWDDWKKFIRLAQKRYPTLKYLVIAERQKRGAIHFHAAVHGYMHANSIRALWLSVVGSGNIDIKRRKHNQSLHGLAKYLTKYLTKQYDELESFKNLYRCSRNIKLTILKWYLPKEYALHRQSMIEEAIIFWLKRVAQYWGDANGLYSVQWASTLSP